MQDLCDWIRNNWQAAQTIHHPPVNRKMLKLDVLWRKRQDKILDEVQLIHEEQGRSGDPDTFGLQNTAASWVYA